ncbi:Tetratricopeptide repeat (TPR)-like superfamily protein isoform 1 [Hibiscus syriacus]|uniref:Tetratricopeptide repeat (TPR)-like superfamily protein isoform 1 n=1 Tax=Hibiscus syriacus TaxID=106335 RepID=A0A6A2YKE7_HIBSY|nr:cysteine proteinase inhibitor B-like [Hibiscus syriacus]KAE8677604.1 Tetratricopeptide repeat (TPR)-like superfamily protein isoform 1 [Hibiscus syriacus]
MAKAGVIILLSLLLLVITVSTFTVVEGLGGRTPINDVKNNKEVQELGRFSVEEYNRRRQGRLRHNGGGSSSSSSTAALVFSQVVEAEKQVVSGIKYYLKIKAMQGGLTKTFESVVLVKPWAKSKDLLNFSPSKQ